jgi:MerR family transcriptional regulator, light-induced transcriptional regulator
MSIDRSPIYNLNAVLKETGLKADVLRAWERRYELPIPQRSAGGHRLYSEYDIETVKWLRARQAEGLSISRAVELWREIHQSGRDPLSGYGHKEAQPPQPTSIADMRIDSLRNLWLEACLNFDDHKAEEALNLAFVLYPVEMVCTEILQKGLNMIGEAWYSGKASVQQEHFASALAARRLETLISATPMPTRRQTVLVGCPPGEWHTLSALMFSLFLRRKGLKVVYLGANIPALQIEETAAAIQPNLIVLATQQLTTSASLQSLVSSLQKLGTPISFGGLVFNRIPELRQRIPAHFLGESMAEGMERIEQLLASPTPAPAAILPDNSLQETARLFRENRAMLERELDQDLQRAGLQYSYIREASAHFNNGLAAALELGDIAFLEADLDWVRKLLSGQQLPGERLHYFLAAYKQTIFNQLGEDSVPITQWIDAYLKRIELKK